MKERCCRNVKNSDVIVPYEQTEEHYVELDCFEPKVPYEVVKRCLDIFFSLVALSVLFLPMCVIAVVIKCTSKGTVLYAQERLGKNGKPFKVIKFRSMVDDAEKNGVQWSGKDDPRITGLGVYLRRYHIDELPQLWNIFVGEMSFVGPRPERKCYYDVFETYIHGFHHRMKVKPGLTGLAQVSGGSLMRPEEKIVYDIDYIKNRSVWMDLRIVIKTVVTVITGRYAG